MVKRVIMVVVLIMLFVSLAFSLPGDIKVWRLTWTPNTEADLSGYRVYWSSTDGNWNNTSMIAVPKSSNPEQVLTGVIPSNRYLCVTAVDSSGNESNKSASIFFDKDITAPAAVGGLVIQ